MSLLTDLVYWIVVIGLGIQVVGAFCLVAFYFKKAPPLRRRDKYPGVTLLKPCHRAEDNEEENFDALFHQDYPGPLELLFVVSVENAPIVGLVNDYLRRYPNVDARLLVSRTRQAFWKKVDANHDGHLAAKHDYLIWTDSDSVVKNDYVSQMVPSLEEPGVSVVTVPQCDIRVNNFATAFKVLGNTCDLATFIMILRLFPKHQKVGWGHSMAFRKSEFDSFEGGWEWINFFLADDQALPSLFVKNGRKVVWRNIYCPVEYSSKTLAQVISQKRRWVAAQRIAVPNRYVYLLALLVYPQIPAAVLVLLTGFSMMSLKVFLVAALVRIGVSLLQEILFLRSVRMISRYFWTIVLWDLSQVAFILDGFWNTEFNIDGKRYKVVNRYFLKRV